MCGCGDGVCVCGYGSGDGVGMVVVCGDVLLGTVRACVRASVVVCVCVFGFVGLLGLEVGGCACWFGGEVFFWLLL